MYMPPKLRPTVWDSLVVLAVLALALYCILTVWSGGEGLSAVISIDKTVVETVELSRLAVPEERTLKANGYTLHLSLASDGVYMASSDCPNQECVHTGRISKAGQSIVCLPARVLVCLDGGEADVDAVVG